MAVVRKKSNLFPNFVAGDVPPDPLSTRGRLICAAFAAANEATDSSGSMYKLADLPADCVLDALTTINVGSWGFAQVNIGTSGDIDALITVAKSAGTYVTPVTRAGANHEKRLWEVLGLSAPPASNVISLYAHASAAATAAGSIKGEIWYRYH